MRRRLVPIVFGLLVWAAAPAAAQAASLGIDVLSNRADLISAGDALVEVKIPAGVSASKVRVYDDARDVTSSFALRPNGRFEGLVDGLALGANVLRASAPGAQARASRSSNHPNGGPVFSGPQVQPWVCQASAADAQCNQPATYAYQYKSSIDRASSPPTTRQSPPSDVATTTTDQGETVPFIVRVETGYQDRDQYKIAVLYDPSKPWAPWAPQDAVEPQAADHPRRELRHRPPGRLGARRR